MAKLILTDYDFNKNQLLNPVIQVLATAPGTPVQGQVYYNSADQTFYGRNSTVWINLGSLGGGVTNLTFSRDGTTVTVISDTGTNAILPTATTSLAGVMSAVDKTKLDGVATGANLYVHPNHSGDVTSVADGATTIANNAVTNAKLADVGTSTIKGRVTAATGDPEDLTPTQVRTLINVANGADVTNTASVDAAGAVMESDIAASPAGRIINDNSMVTASATTLATSLSIKTYVDGAVTGGTYYKGGYNAATNTPNLDLASPIANAIGSMYTVTADGLFFSEAVQTGDVLIAKVANPTTLADWTTVNKNIPDIVSTSETVQGLIEIATQAETTTGTDDIRAITPLKLRTNLGVTATLNNAVRYTATIGNGSLTTIAVTHSIGRQFVTAQTFQTISPFAKVESDIELTSTTVTTFKFNVAPTSNQYTVVITG